MHRFIASLLAGLSLAGCAFSTGGDAPSPALNFAATNVSSIAPKLRPSDLAPPEAVITATTTSKAVFSGLNFLRSDTSNTTTIIDSTLGQAPRYGTLARVCGVKSSELGTKVAQYPEKRPRYRLYDSDPTSTAPRVHYMTGLDGGCALQITGALATFGSAEVHETMQYAAQPTGQFTGTAAAYEKIKARICDTEPGQSCKGRRGERFRDRAVFLSVYDQFSSSPRWMDVLFYDGRFLDVEDKGF